MPVSLVATRFHLVGGMVVGKATQPLLIGTECASGPYSLACAAGLDEEGFPYKPGPYNPGLTGVKPSSASSIVSGSSSKTISPHTAGTRLASEGRSLITVCPLPLQ